MSLPPAKKAAPSGILRKKQPPRRPSSLENSFAQLGGDESETRLSLLMEESNELLPEDFISEEMCMDLVEEDDDEDYTSSHPLTPSTHNNNNNNNGNNNPLAQSGITRQVAPPQVLSAAAGGTVPDQAPSRPARRSTLSETKFHFRPTIVLFGDSLTQEGFGVVTMTKPKDPSSLRVTQSVGWASLLAAAYTRRADVINRGFSGYNTDMALQVMPRLFGSLYEAGTKCLLTVIWFGANDACLPGNGQHVDIDEYRENLKGMIIRLRQDVKSKPPSSSSPASPAFKNNSKSVKLTKWNDFPILLLTPPPVAETAWAQHKGMAVSDRSNEIARQYGDVVKEVVAAADPRCAVVDTWELLQGESDESVRGQYLSDGLHLNAKGNQAVFCAIIATIQRHFPKFAPMYDGDGKYGKMGIPMEEALWKELVDEDDDDDDNV